jgi:hypothetical protein
MSLADQAFSFATSTRTHGVLVPNTDIFVNKLPQSVLSLCEYQSRATERRRQSESSPPVGEWTGGKERLTFCWGSISMALRKSEGCL